MVQEFYANLHDDIDLLTNPTCYKVFVRGHVFELFYVVIRSFLQLLGFIDVSRKKDYNLNEVASKLLGDSFQWPATNCLHLAELTLPYSGLQKILIYN